MGTFFQLAADNAAAVVLAFLETWAQSDIWAETVADGIPDGFSLDQNYPNPFNSSTMMSYSVPSASFVTFRIYDILGREIQTLVSEFQRAGTYSIVFNGDQLSSGVYFYRLQVGDDFSAAMKMVLMR